MGNSTPNITAGWISNGTISFDDGDFLIVQAFAGELVASKYYKFPVTVTYPDANDVKLDTLSIGGAQVADTGFGSPWVEDGTDGSKGAVEISPAQNGAAIAGSVPVAAAGSTISYALSTQGGEPEAWQGTVPSFTFEDNDELWIKIAAGTQTIKTYKIVITIKTWTADDAVLSTLSFNGDFDFITTTYGYTATVSDFGTPATTTAGAVAGSFSVEEGKQGLPAYGVTGLYITALSASGAPIHFAKTATGVTDPPADEAWVSAAAGAMGPPTVELANNDTFWVRVTAGTFVNYYKFTVTVTPPVGE
jgi:hypothetical protein